jgi:NACHT domain-containing protein
MSEENNIGRAGALGDINARRDAYVAGRDMTVTNNYVTAPDMTVGFRARVVGAAEELAAAVAEQWRREERLRRIQDPVPIPVRWRAADPLLSDHMANIRRMPADAVNLDGNLNEAVDVFTAIPSHRLVVIGQPGAGKTVFTLRFTLDLLARRQPGDPVPVIIGLHTWNPDEQSLQDWMAQRLATDYPALRVADKSGRTIASELVRGHLIIPVLDGLDEVAMALRGEALRALNMSLDRDAPVIVTCRAADYRQIVAESDVLTSAVVIELLPLEFVDLAEYLPRTARKIAPSTSPGFTTKWDPVLSFLRSAPDCPLLKVLRTPLMTSLARSIYSDTSADPAELVDGGFASRDAIEAHLLNGFIPAAFARSPGRGGPATDYARRWLGFLAVHLDRLETRDFEWWRLESSVPAPVRWLMPGLVAWLSIGLVYGTVQGSAWTWLYGLLGALGLTAGLAAVTAGTQQAVKVRSARWRRVLLRPVYMSAAAAVSAGVVAGVAINANTYDFFGSLSGDKFSFPAFLLIGFAAGIVMGIVGIDMDQAPTTTPLRLRRRLRTLSRRPPWGRIVTGGFLVVGISFAWALSFGVTQAVRIVAAPTFPYGGSALARLGNGDSYTDYTDGLRYVVSAKSGKYIVTTRKMKFYTPYVGGVAEGSFYGTEAECLAENVGFGCRVHPAEMLMFSSDSYGFISATTLAGKDDLSPYDVQVDAYTPFNVKISDWLTAPHLSEVPGDAFAIEGIAILILFPVCIVSGLLLWLALPSDITQAVSPVTILRTDRNAAMFRGLALSLLLLVGFIVFDLATGRVAQVWHVLHETASFPTIRTVNGHRVASVVKVHIGTINGHSVWSIALILTWRLALGLIWSIALGLLTITLSPWLRFQVARSWLAARGRIPWRLMGFLEEAHARGVLRQAGAVYQFRHARLQERLAKHSDQN